MDTRLLAGSPLYLLERSDVGVVQLDSSLTVVAMNSFARRVLPVEDKQPFEKMVLSFHPERSVAKVKFLLDQAECPVSNPPPMTMIINIPERVLLIKVTRVTDFAGAPAGYTLVFYDMTELVAAAPSPAAGEPDQRRRLMKIPAVAGQRMLLVDADDILALHSDGHYTRVVTADANRFCNLSIGDLEGRLDPEHFMRVHRSHIVRLSAIASLSREGGRLAALLVNGGAPVPVSRTSATELLARLGMRAAPGPAPRKTTARA